MPTPTLACGYGDGMAANTVYAIPVGPYRLLTSGAITFSTTVGGSFSTLSGANTEPGVLVSGGFVKAASQRTYVLKPINNLIKSYANLVGRANPLSYWRLGEQTGTTLYDQMAARNNLTAGSGVTLGTTGPLGDKNFAVTLDGTVNGVCSLVGPNTWSGGTALSFEAWIYNPAFAVGHEMVISLGSVGIYLSFENAKLVMSIHTGTQLSSRSIASVTAAAWHHIVGTWESTDFLRLYVDGAAVAGDNVTTRTGALSSAANIYIGAFGGSALFYSGIVDEVAIYLRKLTAVEIKNHYGARLVS